MVGIKINNKHSFSDYGLILSSKTIESPSVKSKTIDIAGGDGVLDLTDFFGEPRFKTRMLTFVFTKAYSNSVAFNEDWSTLQNELNGKKVKITLDEDDDFYYEGRLSLSYTKQKNVAKITMKCECEPYKLKHENTVVTKNGSGTVVLNNLRKRCVPKIVTTAETTLVFGSITTTINAGEHVIPEIELVSGSNTVSVTSTGTTTFTYKEGGL